MSWFRRKQWVPCPDCVGKGRPSRWHVPDHVNYPGWPVVRGYDNWCFTCDGRGKVRDEVPR